jgi:lipopolysaccharide export system protein LptA
MARKSASSSLARRSYVWWLLACLAAGQPLGAWAAEAGGKAAQETKRKSGGAAFQASRKDPIIITANWMEADRKKNTITYKGQVVAVQADMTMRSETLTAYYDPQMKQLREAVAEGKVQVVQGDKSARGAKAVFNGKAQTVTLTGSPLVRQGNSEISGSRITFFIEEDRAVVEGGSERVKAIIFPEELQEREKSAGGPGK